MKQRKCFVIMPFSKTDSCTENQWTKIYTETIKPAVTGSGYGFTCERIQPGTGNIIRDILNKLNEADLVIADLTDQNPNVFYELGVRHTLSNHTILITQNMDFIASDLRPYWVVMYKKGKSGVQDFKKKTKTIIKDILKEPDKSDSPVKDFIKEKNITLLSQEKLANAKKLAALVSELSYNKNATKSLPRIIGKMEEFFSNGRKDAFTSIRCSNSCIELILSTRYIELPKELLKKLIDANNLIKRNNIRINYLIDKNRFTASKNSLLRDLPRLENLIICLMKEIGKIRLEYVRGNYQEPPSPTILLADRDDEKYILSS